MLGLMVVTIVTGSWVDRAWPGLVICAVTVALWSPEFSRRPARLWVFFYVGGTFFYTLLRALADETAVPIRTGYVIGFDRALFFGQTPGTWLQDRLFDPSGIGFLEWGAVLTHWSFFVAPHALGVYLFLFRRDLFPRYCGLMLVVLYLALALFFIVPTTPPWLAGLQGELPLDGSYRILEFAGRSVDPEAYNSLYSSLGEPNSVAAMPSLHLGLTFAMYLFARRHLARLGTLLLGYSLLMGVALVYLAEHYVADLLGGAACAVAAFLLVEWVARPRASLTAPAPADSGGAFRGAAPGGEVIARAPSTD